MWTGPRVNVRLTTSSGFLLWNAVIQGINKPFPIALGADRMLPLMLPSGRETGADSLLKRSKRGWIFQEIRSHAESIRFRLDPSQKAFRRIFKCGNTTGNRSF